MRVKRIVSLASALVLMVVLLASCATRPDLAPIDQARANSWKWMHLYKTQFQDHEQMSRIVNLTLEQKKMLNAKADLLTKIKPYLDLYVSYVEKGAIPPTDVETKLFPLMNELQTYALGQLTQ